jgi:DNA-binding response OmpR family regulator
MKILIVDDDPIVIESCKRILRDTEFESLYTSSVDEALENLENHSIGLIIADIKMPEKDGLYLISICKKRFPHIPILVISGYSTEETIRHSLSTGAEKYIPKPFTPEELINAINNILNNHKENTNT